MRLRIQVGLLVAVVCLHAGAGVAQPKLDVPAPLAPWVQWVLFDAQEHACAFSKGRALCSWPGKLVLDLGAQGGRFEQRVWVDRELYFMLPGSNTRWPSAVRVDGRAEPVLEQAGGPSVLLRAGAHRLEGRFEWKALPERLELPSDTAEIVLRVDGKLLPFPKRDEHGQLWLQGGPAGDAQGEQLGLTVSRKLEDGVPLITTTRIKLRVSGRAREVSLGHVLLTGTTPLSLKSELPARLEEGGELRLQVRAGTYAVELQARSDRPPEQLAYRSSGRDWPASEIWVFQADEALRQVELSGAPAIDPARTELDPEWRGLPTFALREGVALHFTSTRRGEQAPPPNRLGLERELWLDLDGRGYTVRDRISAELRQGFRLDLLSGELGHVSADGEDLLITQAKGGRAAGVELRKQKQNLVAEWRMRDRLSTLPAVAWSEDVQSLSATLHLGPGFRLLAARGVDSVSGTWFEAWDLFDFFFVLVIALAVGRLVGRWQALLALLALVLCHGEPDAPEFVWFALLLSIGLLRVLPLGWFRNLVRLAFVASAVTLLVVVVPFAVDQVRVALYPQLAQAWLAGAESRGGPEMPASSPVSAPAPASAPEEAKAEGGAPVSLERLEQEPALQRAGSSSPQRMQGLRLRKSEPDARTAVQALQQDPEATVQTGPGVPTWAFRSWRLHWSGPVDKGHQIELYLLSPGANRALSFLRVALLLALVGLLLRAATPGRARPGSAPRAGVGVAVGSLFACLTAVAAVWLVPAAVRADLPDQDLLHELRERLLKPPACRPECASIDELRISVSDAGLTLAATVHAGERTTVRLPGPAATWVPAEVTLDRQSDAPMILLEDGFLHVRVDQGVHMLQARGPLPPSETLTLALADRPRRAHVDAVGWKVDGVREDGRVEEALQLSRLLSAKEGKALEGAALPPFFLLTRELELGPSWELHGTLTRVSPKGTPLVVRVPLLAGESVTESALEVADGELHVSFGRDDELVEWRSRLKLSDRIALTAAQGRPWTERWRVVCGPIWHCELDGLTPTRNIYEGRFEPELTPWPGESANVRVSRPEPAAGQSVTIDSVELVLMPGVRMQNASLGLNVRSSRGATQTLSLPQDARVQQLLVDRQERPTRVEHDKLALTLGPGSHAILLQWQEARGMSSVLRVPEVGLGRGAANASVRVELPAERWLLWASGPAWGPAILFWGYLLVALGAALLLSRVGLSPLRAYQWMLLALGLTQLPAPGALCVAGWFFALAYRSRAGEQPRWLHNSGQVLLAAWTFAALSCLYFAVHAGLLMRPDMQVEGAASYASSLRWYVDRIDAALPTPVVISVPLWVWRVCMLAWSLWLAASLVRWLPWAFGCFKHGGLWKSAPPKRPRPPPGAAPQTAAAPPPTTSTPSP